MGVRERGHSAVNREKDRFSSKTFSSTYATSWRAMNKEEEEGNVCPFIDLNSVTSGRLAKPSVITHPINDILKMDIFQK